MTEISELKLDGEINEKRIERLEQKCKILSAQMKTLEETTSARIEQLEKKNESIVKRVEKLEKLEKELEKTDRKSMLNMIRELERRHNLQQAAIDEHTRQMLRKRTHNDNEDDDDEEEGVAAKRRLVWLEEQQLKTSELVESQASRLDELEDQYRAIPCTAAYRTMVGELDEAGKQAIFEMCLEMHGFRPGAPQQLETITLEVLEDDDEQAEMMRISVGELGVDETSGPMRQVLPELFRTRFANPGTTIACLNVVADSDTPSGHLLRAAIPSLTVALGHRLNVVELRLNFDGRPHKLDAFLDAFRPGVLKGITLTVDRDQDHSGGEQQCDDWSLLADNEQWRAAKKLFMLKCGAVGWSMKTFAHFSRFYVRLPEVSATVIGEIRAIFEQNPDRPRYVIIRHDTKDLAAMGHQLDVEMDKEKIRVEYDDRMVHIYNKRWEMTHPHPDSFNNELTLN